MSEWWCVASGNGYSDIPVAFQTAVNRGNKITGAAWRKGSGQTFVIAIEAVLAPQYDEKQARNQMQKKFLPTMTIGKTLPLCKKFPIEHLRQAEGSSFFQYFHHQGFQMLRPTVSEAIVPVPSSNSISDADSDICHYTVLGLQPGATGSDINTAARTLMKLYHPDKGHGDTAKFIQVHEAMLALTGRMPDDCGERKLCVAPKQDKTYEDMTICELSKLNNDCSAYATKLHIELQRVHAVGVEA